MAVNIHQLEEEMEEIKMIMKIWHKFYKILMTTFYSTDANLKDLDRDFQQIKQIVAEHHGHFMKVIKKDFHIGQSVLTTVKRTISLEGFKGLSHLEINKTLIEWHDANILLNETLGSLECERDRVQRGRVKSSVPQKSGKQKAKELMQNSTLKMIANLVVLGIIAGVFYMYWPDIVKSPFYQTYLAGWVDMVTGLFSMPPTAIPAPK